jgi:FlaG/FlaF family flagellin (archaellin)
MKAYRRFIEQSRAVSNVIGIVVVIAIFAGIAVVVYNSMQDVSRPTPPVNTLVDLQYDGTNYELTIEHRGGDTIEAAITLEDGGTNYTWNNLQVKINGELLAEDGGGEKYDIEPLFEETAFRSGEEITVTFDGTTKPEAGDVIAVVYTPRSQLLTSKQL